MSNEEARIQLFNLNAESRNIRKKMKKTLEYAGQGDLEEAMEIFEEAEKALSLIKEEYSSLKECTREKELLEEQEGYMGFTEIVKDSVKQTALRNNRCGGVRFHVYS